MRLFGRRQLIIRKLNKFETEAYSDIMVSSTFSIRLLASTNLRDVLGTKTLAEVLSDRNSIATELQSILSEATARWGIKVQLLESLEAASFWLREIIGTDLLRKIQRSNHVF